MWWKRKKPGSPTYVSASSALDEILAQLGRLGGASKAPELS